MSSVVAREEDSAAVTVSSSKPPVFNLLALNYHSVSSLSIVSLHQHYSLHHFTPSQLVAHLLAHIHRVNPYLECVIEINPSASDIANELNVQLHSLLCTDGDPKLPPLFGVPILLKDTMATKDLMQTTAGSWSLLGCIVPADAFIVKQLREAGAIILGKTNLDEWAGMRGDVYSCGYTARGGQTRNPYNLTLSASGSSTGSAVAVAAGIVPIAFGTETDTSIIGPALACGVVGIKPTVGLASRTGIVPISETQDSIGPYAQTVADAARALDVIAVSDPEDPYTTVPERRQPKSFSSCLATRHALRGARFGLPQKRFWELAPYPQKAVAERVLEFIRKAGAELFNVEMPCAEERIHKDGHWDWERYGESDPVRSEITVSKVETYYLMHKYLSKLENTEIRSLEDVVKYNDENNGTEAGHGGLPAWLDGQDLFRECVQTKGIKNDNYHAALKWIRLQCRDNGIDAALKQRIIDIDGRGKQIELDALIFCDIKLAGTNIAAQAGYPVVALPIGLDPDGMPVGLTIQHTAWQDDKCIKWASAIEDLLIHENIQICKSMEGKEIGEEEKRQRMLGRVPPMFKEHRRKNIPVLYQWRYKGAPKYNVTELRAQRMARGEE